MIGNRVTIIRFVLTPPEPAFPVIMPELALRGTNGKIEMVPIAGGMQAETTTQVIIIRVLITITELVSHAMVREPLGLAIKITPICVTP